MQQSAANRFFRQMGIPDEWKELKLGGIEWLVEAFGCQPEALKSLAKLRELFQLIVSTMQLRPIGDPVWHQFPGTGGITGIWLLQESHLTVHSFPEFSSICLNVFCCRPRPALDWKLSLSTLLGASEIEIREYSRCYDKPGERP